MQGASFSADPGPHQLWPALGVRSREEVAQTSPTGSKATPRQRPGGDHAPPPPPPRCALGAHLRPLIRSVRAGGTAAARAQPRGPRPGSAAETPRLGTNSSAQADVLPKPRFQPGLRHSHRIPGAPNEKPGCPPPRGALAADLFTLPAVERPPLCLLCFPGALL